MDDNLMEDRIEKLESALAHLERLYDQLNQVVIEQERVIRRLQSQQSRLGSSLEDIELERIHATNAKPPHSASRL